MNQDYRNKLKFPGNSGNVRDSCNKLKVPNHFKDFTWPTHLCQYCNKDIVFALAECSCVNARIEHYKGAQAEMKRDNALRVYNSMIAQDILPKQPTSEEFFRDGEFDEIAIKVLDGIELTVELSEATQVEIDPTLIDHVNAIITPNDQLVEEGIVPNRYFCTHDESLEYFIPPRETHPHFTQVGLVGGVNPRRGRATAKGRRRNPRINRRDGNMNRRDKAATTANSKDSFARSEKMTIVDAPGGTASSLLVKLRYNSDLGIMSSGSPIFAANFNLNNTYDKQGSLLTPSLLNYAQYSVLYNFNIVNTVELSITLSNLCDFAVCAVFCPSNSNPYVPLNVNDVRDRTEGSFSKTVVLAPKYGSGDQKTMRIRYNLSQVYGNTPEYLGSGLYSCTTGSGPSVTYYGNILLYSPDGSALSAGVDMVYRETDYVKFYSPTLINDTTYKQKMIDQATEIISCKKKSLATVSTTIGKPVLKVPY